MKRDALLGRGEDFRFGNSEASPFSGVNDSCDIIEGPQILNLLELHTV